MSDAPAGQVVVVKSWHLVITILVLFGGMFITWGTYSAQTNQNSKDIEKLQAQPFLTKEIYEERQKEIERRLERIENKVDNIDLREYRIEGGDRVVAKKPRQPN